MPCLFFFFNDTATTEIYTLSLHDALPICAGLAGGGALPSRRDLRSLGQGVGPGNAPGLPHRDRKSTRLNSSHGYISYAVFCLKKKQKITYVVYPPVRTSPSMTASDRRPIA